MNFADYIALVAILVAVVALAYQISQNVRQLRLQNFAALTQRYHEIMLNIPIWSQRSTRTIADLPQQDREDLLHWVAAYLELCSAEQYVHKKGLLPSSVWRHWQQSMSHFFSQEPHREAWSVVSQDRYYDQEFRQLVEKVMRNPASPNENLNATSEGRGDASSTYALG